MRVQEDEGEQVFGNGMTTSQMKKSTGAYFDKMQNANASRSDKIKPSEGGKYGGFGSGGQAHQMSSGSDDFVGKLSEGWSFLSAAATTVAAKAAQKTAELGSQLNENVIAPTREKARRQHTDVVGWRKTVDSRVADYERGTTRRRLFCPPEDRRWPVKGLLLYTHYSHAWHLAHGCRKSSACQVCLN